MLRNNPVLAQLKEQIRAATPRVEGVVKATDKNFGFLETDDGKSYFLSPPVMKQLLHGDRVEAIVHEEGDKTSAEPETLLVPGLDRFIARVRNRDGRPGVIPDHPNIRQILASRLKEGLAENKIEDGDWVVARLVRHPLKNEDRSFFSEIEELLAKNDDPTVPWAITLARHGLEQSSPDEDTEWRLQDEGLIREDLTGEPFFTIDSEASLDLDDALRVKPLPEGGWELTVAVADPTAYIDEGHPVDKEASTRGFTTYLPGLTITMLPEALSCELCSLVEGQDRPTLACTLFVNADGSLGGYRFFAATIHSRARLAYKPVSDWLEGKTEWTPEKEIADQLELLADVTAARVAWRNEHGVPSGDRPDYVFDLDPSGAVLGIRVEEPGVANRMIEEAMIAANLCCTDLLVNQGGQGIFNVHEAFDSEKLGTVQQLLAGQDIAAEMKALTDLEHYRQLRRTLDALDNPWLDIRLRRYQGLSTFSPRPGAHFGMGIPAYATWTSPIRKYGDMVNHRLIKRALRGEGAVGEIKQELVDQLSERRRLNRRAERDVKDWLYVRFLGSAAQSGQTYKAEIVAINRGGMRVRLIANGASAFVPASLIHEDRKALKIDEQEGRVRIREEVCFQLGDFISVSLTEAREDTRSLIAKVVVSGGSN